MVIVTDIVVEVNSLYCQCFQGTLYIKYSTMTMPKGFKPKVNKKEKGETYNNITAKEDKYTEYG